MKKVYGNGIKEEREYDGGRRLNRQIFGKSGQILQDLEYGWSGMGMKMLERRMPEGLSDTYRYDSVYRLIEAKLGMTDPSNPGSFKERKEYTLDFLDNIRKILEEEGGKVEEIRTEINSMNQYTRFGDINLRYDRRGNLIEKGGRRFEYDWANRLISVEEGGKRVEFKYDALGRRISKTVKKGNQTETINYYYDGWQVIEERDDADRVKAQYVYSGLDRPVEMRKYKEQGAESYFFHQNSIGSVYFITDEEGKIVEKVEYQPYGQPRFLIPTGDPENPYQIQAHSSIGNFYLFQGREFDPETGLYNFRMRYYDPELCRFLSLDPEGYKDSVNLYQSFNQNPINFTDPYGLQFRADTMTGEDPNKLMERWEKEGKVDEWERISKAWKEISKDPSSPSFYINEFLEWTEQEKECFLRYINCMIKELVPFGELIFTGKAGEGEIRDIAELGAGRLKSYYEEKAWRHQTKGGTRILTGMTHPKRSSIWRRYMERAKWLGRFGSAMGVVGLFRAEIRCFKEEYECMMRK